MTSTFSPSRSSNPWLFVRFYNDSFQFERYGGVTLALAAPRSLFAEGFRAGQRRFVEDSRVGE
ncbi:hypothetical protein [Nocardia lijiangensis]|uniref:hypothetical protein n=1 Tax=Nocardia lijiangensis TaxID=299618 RepID=UPI003D71F057